MRTTTCPATCSRSLSGSSWFTTGVCRSDQDHEDLGAPPRTPGPPQGCRSKLTVRAAMIAPWVVEMTAARTGVNYARSCT